MIDDNSNTIAKANVLFLKLSVRIPECFAFRFMMSTQAWETSVTPSKPAGYSRPAGAI